MFSNSFEFIKKHIEKRCESDIPLDHGTQTKFLILLIALMTFMLVLISSGILILNNMTERWSSGLKNKLTIEIPVETSEGYILSRETVRKETKKLHEALKTEDYLQSIDIVEENEIRQLISPWISPDLELTEIPLPGLIAVKLQNASPANIKQLEEKVSQNSSYAKLETHREWLEKLLAFIINLKRLSIFITSILFVITITSIATAMHTRLSLYKTEVELLHLMGADDRYIAQQFQPHALIMTFKGSAIGATAALVIILLTTFFSYNSENDFIPSLSLDLGNFILIICCPILIISIALITSWITILRSLLKMP